MTYHELMSVKENSWITEGPDTKGMGGYALYDHKLFAYYGYWGQSEPKIYAVWEVNDFITQHQYNSKPSIHAIVRTLKEQFQ
ncbi:MAG: hypothetical protein JNN12_13525 [Bacteroidetes Order II. Incertae sedis bacterium]|nr:hypothetical protein [Bacteroidetes Order II. bacterium]